MVPRLCALLLLAAPLLDAYPNRVGTCTWSDFTAGSARQFMGVAPTAGGSACQITIDPIHTNVAPSTAYKVG